MLRNIKKTAVTALRKNAFRSMIRYARQNRNIQCTDHCQMLTV